VNGTDTDEITAYVQAVRAALVGLPESTRDELTEDLPEHLAEVLADGVGSLTDRLGPPEAYAAELRASAGFVGGFPDPPPTVDPLARLRATATHHLGAADVRFGPVLGYPRVSDFLRLLRPAWWVLRGYLAAMVLAWILDDSGQPIGLLPRIGGSEVVALLLLAAAVLGSIWLGRRSLRLERFPRYALYAGSAVLVLVALGGFLDADSSTRGSGYAEVSDYSDPYGHVRDVYVYDSQGRLVEGARIFDQDGQPIRLGSSYCYDDPYGDTRPEVDNGAYPRCGGTPPFVVPSDGSAPLAPDPADPEPTATADPGESAAPGPSASATARPSVSPSASPSAGR
jgi:hypothetical protein